jgi:hypothetical protein
MKNNAKRHSCPMCKKDTIWDGNPFRPFCSERCRLMDLGKWASEEYTIAGEKQDMADKGDEDSD